MTPMTPSSTTMMCWSTKQSHILTGGGRADALYHADRGFPFQAEELPHFHLCNGSTFEAFRHWREADPRHLVIVGAWRRTLFSGGFQHTDWRDETVFNLQTPSLFIDLRIPTSRPSSFAAASSLAALTGGDLKQLARQHCFSGYSRVASLVGGGGTAWVCTRHHVIDWNFVGNPRSRPNKWRIEPDPADRGTSPGTSPCRAWTEWSFATDDHGQSYYFERWQRWPGDGMLDEPATTTSSSSSSSSSSKTCPPQSRECHTLKPPAPTPLLALRTVEAGARQKTLVVVGDHFAVARDRTLPLGSLLATIRRAAASPHVERPGGSLPSSSLVGLVDWCVEAGLEDVARGLLSLEGAHGRVNGCREAGGAEEGPRWIVDAATHPWQEGSVVEEIKCTSLPRLLRSSRRDDEAHAELSDDGPLVGGHVLLAEDEWEILECSFDTEQELVNFLSPSRSDLQGQGGPVGSDSSTSSVKRSRL